MVKIYLIINLKDLPEIKNDDKSVVSQTVKNQ